MMDAITMYCPGTNAQGYGGYNGHPHTGKYKVIVPFKEAIFNPPTCPTHNLTYLTIGGYRLFLLLERFRETGTITDQCSVYYGLEQSSGCPPHGWYGRASETDADDHCPYWRLATWIVRRHAQEVN